MFSAAQAGDAQHVSNAEEDLASPSEPTSTLLDF